MKKRVLSVFLALALCVGMTVPAFAAERDDVLESINGEAIWFDVDDMDGLTKDMSVKFVTWSPDNGTYTKAKEATDAIDLKVFELPLGVTITIGPDNTYAQGGGFSVYTDSDGDGVYEQRLLKVDEGAKEISTVPTDATSVKDTSTVFYYGLFFWNYGHDNLSWGQGNQQSYRDITTDALMSSFGLDSEALFEFWDADGENAMYILVTAEERPEDMAYDKLEDHGVYVSDAGNLTSSWAVEYESAAVDAGLFSLGIMYDHDCDLTGKITRAQFAQVTALLYQAMSGEELDVPEEMPFEDVDEDYAYYDDIAVAYELGIVGGYPDGTFQPDTLVSREQAATMLSRAYTKLGGEIPEVEATAFSDDEKISSYAKDAVAFMTEKGIIGGMGGNTFAPKGDATVEQALKIAVEMLNNLEVK